MFTGVTVGEILHLSYLSISNIIISLNRNVLQIGPSVH